jgi:hypothetical protein
MQDNILLTLFSKQSVAMAEQRAILKVHSTLMTKTSQTISDMTNQLLGNCAEVGDWEKLTIAIEKFKEPQNPTDAVDKDL